MKQADDYTIRWDYIVDRIRERYGIPPDSDEKFSIGEIEVMIEEIWEEKFFGGEDDAQ